MRDLTDHNTQ